MRLTLSNRSSALSGFGSGALISSIDTSSFESLVKGTGRRWPSPLRSAR
jgi:hypothetical protein